MSTTTEPKAAGLPDGLHHRRGVEYLAAAAGMEPDKIGPAVVFGEDLGFSETTGFFKDSRGRGYWMTTLNECSCPSFMYRGGPCKHQKRLAEELQKRAAGPSLPSGVVAMTSEDLDERMRRIAERNAKRAGERAKDPRPATSPRGFNCPDSLAVAPL